MLSERLSLSWLLSSTSILQSAFRELFLLKEGERGSGRGARPGAPELGYPYHLWHKSYLGLCGERQKSYLQLPAAHSLIAVSGAIPILQLSFCNDSTWKKEISSRINRFPLS